MKKLIDLFTILVIIFMSGVFFVSGDYGGNSDSIIKGNITTQVIKALIYLIAFGMLIIKRKYAIWLSLQNVSIWAIMIWVFASVFWSAVPYMTLRLSVALLGTTLIGIFIAVYYKNEEFEKIVGWSFLIILLLSLMVIVFIPSQGIMSYYGTFAWKGIMAHKNGLGMISLFGIVLFPALFSKKAGNAPWLIGFLLSIILLIGSKSTSSLIISMAVLLILGSYVFSLVTKNNISLILLLILFLVLIEVGIFVSNNLDYVLGIFGKNSTLTGRTPMWEMLITALIKNPWLGYGYGAVYLGRDYGPILALLVSSGFDILGSDNGYLDLSLQIGVIGVALVFIVLINILYKVLSSIRNSTRINYYQIWPIIFLMAYIIINVTETKLLNSNSITWIILTVFSFRTPRLENRYNTE